MVNPALIGLLLLTAAPQAGAAEAPSFTLRAEQWWRTILMPAPHTEQPAVAAPAPAKPDLPALPDRSQPLQLIAASPESALAILPSITSAATIVNPDPPVAQLLAPIEQSLAQLWAEMQRQRADHAVSGGPSLSELRERINSNDKDRARLESTISDLSRTIDEQRRAIDELSITLAELQRRLDRIQRSPDAPLPR